MIAPLTSPPWSLRQLLTHSLFPLVALLLLALLPVLGAGWFLLSVFAWWRIVTWIG